MSPPNPDYLQSRVSMHRYVYPGGSTKTFLFICVRAFTSHFYVVDSLRKAISVSIFFAFLQVAAHQDQTLSLHYKSFLFIQEILIIICYIFYYNIFL